MKNKKGKEFHNILALGVGLCLILFFMGSHWRTSVLAEDSEESYSNSGIVEMHYDYPQHPHAISQVEKMVNGEFMVLDYEYDAVGNLLDDGERLYEWDARGNLRKVILGEDVYDYGYVPRSPVRPGYERGELAWKSKNGEVMVRYYPNYIEKKLDDGTWEIEETYQTPAADVVVKRNLELATEALRWDMKDHLNSNVFSFDELGKVSSGRSFLPYGEERQGVEEFDVLEQLSILNDEPSHQYTGQMRDADTGLDYFEARWYNPETAHFISPDPFPRDFPEKVIEQPQMHNEYAYAKGNPVMYNDPSGEVIRAVNRPVLGIKLGSHSFVEIKDNPNINNGERTTLGGYTTGLIFGDLFKGENYHTDYDLSEEDYMSTHTIEPIDGMEQGAFEEKVYESYQGLDKEQGAYSALGVPSFNGQGNSGNVFTQILLNAGVSMETINSYEANWSFDAGLGNELPKFKKESLRTKVNKWKNNVKSFFSNSKK